MRRVLLALVVLVVAGCGGGDDQVSPTDTGTATVPAKATELRVYWLRDGKIWPVRREAAGGAVEGQALQELSRGPTGQESVELGFSSVLPEGVSFQMVTANGVAEVGFSIELPEEGLAQVVYTLSQFPTVKSVEIDGKTYTRADFEDLMPRSS